MDKNTLEVEIKNELRKIEQDRIGTELKKDKFIFEIKNYLGEEIKKEPNRIPKKLSFWEKFKKLF